MNDILNYLKLELKDAEADYGKDAVLILKIGVLLAHSRTPNDSIDQILIHQQVLDLLADRFVCSDIDDAMIVDHLLIAYDHRDGR